MFLKFFKSGLCYIGPGYYMQLKLSSLIHGGQFVGIANPVAQVPMKTCY
jgi:hypothetical protein